MEQLTLKQILSRIEANNKADKVFKNKKYEIYLNFQPQHTLAYGFVVNNPYDFNQKAFAMFTTKFRSDLFHATMSFLESNSFTLHDDDFDEDVVVSYELREVRKW